MSYRKLADGLAHIIEQAEDKTSVDATLLVQMMFEDADRHYASAKVIGGKTLLLVVGLRSEILEPFPMYTNKHVGEYSSCDIPALVPAIALIASEEPNNDMCFMIEKEATHTRLVIGFEAENILTVAKHATRFIDRWTKWRDVLLNILEKESLFEIDWREFLAGETGYLTMNWYSPLSYDTRAKGLVRVKQASNALLHSVLSRKGLEHPHVRGLVSWLEDLKPKQHVQSAQAQPMEGEV